MIDHSMGARKMEPDPLRTESLATLLRSQRRSRVTQDVLWHLFAEAFPTRPHGPQERELLSAVLMSLTEHGIIRQPSLRSRRLWDDSARPTLPRQIVVLRPVSSPPNRWWQQFPWHPRLAWAADLPLLSDEHAAFLRKVHDGLVSDRFALVAPLKYRSLELTGHEKRLLRFAKSQLFGANRLTLEILGCSDEPTPLVWEVVGERPRAIIFENSSPFSVGRTVLTQHLDSPYGLIIYGAGARIERSIRYLTTIQYPLREIDYVGDLDRDGLRIALAMQQIAQSAGLPTPKPAPGLHRLMLDASREFGHPRGWPHPKKRAVRTDADSALLEFLPRDVRSQVALVLASERRIPEEVLGPQALANLWRNLGTHEC